jgi:uncharacterized membrane protein
VSDQSTQSTSVITNALEPEPSKVTLTHVIYGLHALSIVTGLLTSATVIGSFLGGIPSIVAVVLNYINRASVRGTYLDSHFSWQIRTFWFALLWVVISVMLIITIIGIVFAVPALIVVCIWIIYRVARGWLRLNAKEPMPI